MFAPWLSKSTENVSRNTESYTSLPPSRSHNFDSEGAHDGPEQGQLPKRAMSGSLSTPHDAILAELHGHSTAFTKPVEVPEMLVTSPPVSGENVNIASSEGAGDLSSPGMIRSTSAAPTHTTLTSANTPAPTGEILYDPFTGAELGVLVPEQTSTSHATSKDEELWSHLTRVLELQSEIASMHMRMENVGGGARKAPEERGKSKGRQMRGEREWGDNEGEGIEIGEEGAEQAAEQNRKLEEEFAGLAGNFTGRKDAIDQIMDKLDNLSREVTLFHSLVTPTIDFSTSRNNSTDADSTPKPKDPRPSSSASYPQHEQSPDPRPDSMPSSVPMSVSHSEPTSQVPKGVMSGVQDQGRPQAVVESPVSMGGSAE